MLDIILKKFGDHGADSSRRDRFQDQYAAHLCIKMLNDTSITEVICEYGEDVVTRKNGAFELFQVKTKQESVADWRLNDLIPIIGKTFAMVPYFVNVSRCYFISNEGATGTLYGLKAVLNQPQIKWSESEKSFFETFCRNHIGRILVEIEKIDSESKASNKDVRKLLLKLQICTDFHHMTYLEDTNVRSLRKFMEASNGQKSTLYFDDEVGETYDRLLGVVGNATIGRTKEEKTITRSHVVDCIKSPKSRKTLYSFPSKNEVDKAPGKTRLEKKLRLGGFTPLFVQNAREDMVSVLNQAKGWDFGEAAEVLEDIKFRMRHLCIDNYDKVCNKHADQEAVGREILEEIKKDIPRLLDYYRGTDLPFLDEIFLEGIAMSLTSECKLYWSQHHR